MEKSLQFSSSARCTIKQLQKVKNFTHCVPDMTVQFSVCSIFLFVIQFSMLQITLPENTTHIVICTSGDAKEPSLKFFSADSLTDFLAAFLVDFWPIFGRFLADFWPNFWPDIVIQLLIFQITLPENTTHIVICTSGDAKEPSSKSLVGNSSTSVVGLGKDFFR